MQEQLGDFTRNFSKYFFTEEYCSNFFWNVCFQGFFYCPIDKRSFLQAEFVQNGLLTEFDDIVEHVAVFHENYFICSSLPHLNIQDLYSYLVGTTAMGAQSSQRQADSIPVSQIASLFKCSQYKNAGFLKRFYDNKPV